MGNLPLCSICTVQGGEVLAFSAVHVLYSQIHPTCDLQPLIYYHAMALIVNTKPSITLYFHVAVYLLFKLMAHVKTFTLHTQRVCQHFYGCMY